MSTVVVVVFGRNGLDRAAAGTLGAGQRLAEQSGGPLQAVIVGPPIEGMSAAVAASGAAVKVCSDLELTEYQPEATLSALQQVLASLDPAVVLLANDIYSQEITPRLAHRLGGSSMADAADLRWNEGGLEVVRSAYGGKAQAIYRLKRSPAVVWVRARAMEPAADAAAPGAVEEVAVDVAPSSLQIVDRQVEAQEGVRLEDADIIVSGGRGLGGPEPFEMLRQLADTIGAEMGASRAACDAGWVPPSWQVGQTGKKVAPELYMAIAISGASQHLLGMGDSKVICAINTDADAPIFRHCSFGIVEDYKNVVPPLTSKLAELRK